MNNQKNRQPFNLQAALAGARVITRDGREVHELTKFTKVTNSDLNLAGVVNGCVVIWCKDGNYDPFYDKSHLDLFMAPKHDFKLGDEVKSICPSNFTGMKGKIVSIFTSLDSDTKYYVDFKFHEYMVSRATFSHNEIVLAS